MVPRQAEFPVVSRKRWLTLKGHLVSVLTSDNHENASFVDAINGTAIEFELFQAEIADSAAMNSSSDNNHSYLSGLFAKDKILSTM